MRPPGSLRLVPGWGVPGLTHTPLLPDQAAAALCHQPGLGAVAMETGTGSVGTPFSLQPPLARAIFSVCLPLSGAAPRLGGAGQGLLARLLAEPGTPLSSAGGGSSCPTQVHYFWHVEGFEGRRNLGPCRQSGFQSLLAVLPGPLPLGPGIFPMSRTDFRAGASPVSPSQLRCALSLSSTIFLFSSAAGKRLPPPPEMVTQVDILMVIWQESGPKITHPGPCGTRELVAAEL